jgi:hypothetical protein
MRKIEQAMCLAVGQKRTWKDGNTQVIFNEDVFGEYADVFLHKNHIGTYNYMHVTFYVNHDTLAKWPTRTTKSRLRALGVRLV